MKPILPAFVHAAAACALLVCTAAGAQTKSWSLASGGCAESNSSSSDNGNSYSCSGVKLNAYSIATTSGALFATAAVTPQGANGFGVGNASESYGAASTGNGDHSLDNKNSNGIDMLLLKFTSGAEALTKVTVGWASGDSDFQVLRYTGAGDPTVGAKALTTLNSANLLSSGWSLVKAVDGGNTGETDTSYTFNTATVNGKTVGVATSSYWLITAYNSAFGGGLSSGNDALKLLAIGSTAVAAAVSEPGTLAIAGLALAAMVGARRKKRPSATA